MGLEQMETLLSFKLAKIGKLVSADFISLVLFENNQMILAKCIENYTLVII